MKTKHWTETDFSTAPTRGDIAIALLVMSLVSAILLGALDGMLMSLTQAPIHLIEVRQ